MTVTAVAVRWAATDPPERLLGPAERRHAVTLPPWRRRQWTAGRLAGRLSLWLTLGALPADLAILPADDGAPVLSGVDGHTVSLSHSDEWAAGVCGPRGDRVGIDVEAWAACDDALLARVSRAGDAPVAGPASSGWARKEAAYKACLGVPGLLRDYRLAGPDRVAVAAPGRPDRTLFTWWFHLPGAVLAVASGHRRPPALRVLDARTAVDALNGARS